jgi:hypothetical protein
MYSCSMVQKLVINSPENTENQTDLTWYRCTWLDTSCEGLGLGLASSQAASNFTSTCNYNKYQVTQRIKLRSDIT